MVIVTAPIRPEQTSTALLQSVKSTPLSFAEYIEQERVSDVKHHFQFGELIEFANAPYEHNVICGNLISEFGTALEETNCRVIGSNQKIYVSADVVYYSDVIVTCGIPMVTDEEALQNPVLTTETISPSTAANDRGEKFRQYRTISSLRHYLLLEQDRPIVEHFERDDTGIWALRGEYDTLEQNLEMTIIGQKISLPLSKIYRNITFPAPPAAALETTEE